MKTKLFYVISIIFVMAVALITLTGCNNKNSDNIEIEKSLSEIRYLENQTISIFNKFFLDEYFLEDGSIDWNLVNEDFDVIRSSIDVILIDLAGVQVPSKNIVDLENYFNDLETFIQNQDARNFVKRICDVYGLVSYSILDNISENEEIKLEKKSKSDLLYIGYYIMTENKEFILSNLDVFKTNFTALSSNKNYIENNSYKINKIFINIQNLETEINNDNYLSGKTSLTKILELY